MGFRYCSRSVHCSPESCCALNGVDGVLVDCGVDNNIDLGQARRGTGKHHLPWIEADASRCGDRVSCNL